MRRRRRRTRHHSDGARQLRERVGFFAAEGFFETLDRSPQLGVRVNRRYGYQLPDVPGLVRDQVEVHLDAVRGGNTNYATRIDGTLVTSNPHSNQSSDEAESFVRIDPTGVFTAVGTIAQSNDPDSPTGDFELGARCDDGWVERISAG